MPFSNSFQHSNKFVLAPFRCQSGVHVIKPFFFAASLRHMLVQGTLTEGNAQYTDLPIKMGSFVKKEKYTLSGKCELVSARRSTILILPFRKTSLVCPSLLLQENFSTLQLRQEPAHGRLFCVILYG
jgi:hypothetical protein